MNKLVIPSSPNWYETDIQACAPDNTLIFGSRQDLFVIKPTPENEPDDVQVITKAHSSRIKSVNINRNWGQDRKYAVSVSEDKIVKLWDIETLEKKSSHNKHLLVPDDTKVVSASFAGDDKVVSVSEAGIVVIWNITQNETTILNSLFHNKVTITCLSVCPHATWLAAFGLKNGLIAVVDLRKTGKMLYKLRGHDKAVISLSWCPAPVNIFPVKPNNKVVEKRSTEIKAGQEMLDCDTDTVKSEILNQNNRQDDTDEKLQQSVSSTNKESSGAEGNKTRSINLNQTPNPWVGLTHADDEPDDPIQKQESENDFLKECRDLKQKILQINTPKDKTDFENTPDTKKPVSNQPPRVILTAKKASLKEKEVPATAPDVPTQESCESQSVDTPTDRREISMELSLSSEKKLEQKLTDTNETPMELTTCGKEESTNTNNTNLSDTDISAPLDEKESSCDDSKPDTTCSSEESKLFSSVSSCDNDLHCSKRQENLQSRDVKKSDTSSVSEPGDVFHDAHVCDNKASREINTCKIDEPSCFEEQPRKEYLLASSAKEPNIYIWRAGTDGRMQSFITVPTIKNNKKFNRSDKIWITICWVAPNTLLSSSRNAELLQWTLPRPMVQAKFMRQIHKDHWSVLFSIKAPVLYLNEYNFLQKRDINAWTTGMERTILNTDIGSHRVLACYPALGGNVNCLTGSPLDPNRLALGTGEGVVNVWDLSREHKKQIVFSTYYQKIVSSVTALSWHPSVETSLAWGTVEGRVGIIDTVGKKQPKVLPHYFKQEIYKLEWGPLNGDIKNPGLFVVSESKVAVFDPNSKDAKDPMLLEMPDNTFVHTVSWKPDYSMLLVASKSGTLISYTPDLKISNISYIRFRLQSIVWNPNAASNDTTVSRYCQTFVSTVKSTEFIVYDLNVDSENSDDKVIAHFENRNTIINAIEWNPHSSNQLVFVDDSGVAQVYDIETKTVLSTYINPCLDPLLSVYWSPLDQDYVIIGTQAHKIIIWKVSENVALTETEIKSRRKKIFNAQQKEVSDQLLKEKVEVSPTKITEETKLKKSTKSVILPLFYAPKEKTKTEEIKKLLKWKLGDKDVESNIGDSKRIDVLDVFDNQSKMERVLDLNISAFRQQGKHHNGNLLDLFKGDISTAVKDAIEKKRVNPWIISMCPMVSPKLWQSACETYANQLLDEPEADPLEIVTYLLACHKVEEAINALVEASLFREAFVLAKTRFGADNAIVPEILNKWAKNMVYQGNFEFAAQCYISMGKFEEAASVLFRRSDIKSLELAAELAKLSCNEELHKAVLLRFNAFKAEEDKKRELLEVEKNGSTDISKEVTCTENYGEKGLNGKDAIAISYVGKLVDSNEAIEREIKKCNDFLSSEVKANLETENKDLTEEKLKLSKENDGDNNTSLISNKTDRILKTEAAINSTETKDEENEELQECKNPKQNIINRSDSNKDEKEKQEKLKILETEVRINSTEIKDEENKKLQDCKKLKENIINRNDNNKDNRSENKNNGTLCETNTDDRPEKTEQNDVDFSNKVMEVLPDSLRDTANKLDEVAQNVLEVQEGLLSSDEVKKLLSERKLGTEDVKEDKEE